MDLNAQTVKDDCGEESSLPRNINGFTDFEWTK
jgi:hypothetical protein